MSHPHRLSRPLQYLICVVQEAGMRWLVKGAQPGDCLFFYCKCYTSTYVDCPNINIILVSGHATQIEDQDGDELDGLDECSWLYFFVR